MKKIAKTVNRSMHQTFRTKAAPIPGHALPPPTQARGGDVFPDIPVVSHRGESFRLYSDLIEGRVAVINFMSVASQDAFPVGEHLARIAERLGPSLGDDVVICSITTDPLKDSPQALAALAESVGARPGWHFLTAPTGDIEMVSRRLRRHGAGSGPICGPGQGHPLRLVHYGNASAGVWGAFGVDCDPDLAVTRLSWVRSGPPASDGQMRRAGPRTIGDDFVSHNRA